ncbi:MAG TPA: phosphotransferase [Thermoanaerobaculia bacterium]|nr:phosphotransferase [Thermoanaerobaculia bacterium]
MHEAPPPPTPDEVATWLSRQPGLDGGEWRIGPKMGDVSTRQYFRAWPPAGVSLIVAWYPPETARTYDCYRRSTRLLDAVGVRTPKILAVDSASRFMALEDAGEVRLFDLDAGRSAETLFERAVGIADRIRSLPHDEVAELNPQLDATLMLRELDQTWRVFLGGRLERKLGERLRTALEELCTAVTGEQAEPCHRDFMSRNLMVVGRPPDAELVVLDHQDLRLGPRGYDLASLLNDSCALSLRQAARLEASCVEPGGTDHYHRLVVQRALKIVGTFHAFAARGVARYLPMVPRALETALDHLAALPERADLAAELRRQLLDPQRRTGPVP